MASTDIHTSCRSPVWKTSPSLEVTAKRVWRDLIDKHAESGSHSPSSRVLASALEVCEASSEPVNQLDLRLWRRHRQVDWSRTQLLWPCPSSTGRLFAWVSTGPTHWAAIATLVVRQPKKGLDFYLCCCSGGKRQRLRGSKLSRAGRSIWLSMNSSCQRDFSPGQYPLNFFS